MRNDKFIYFKVPKDKLSPMKKIPFEIANALIMP